MNKLTRIETYTLTHTDTHKYIFVYIFYTSSLKRIAPLRMYVRSRTSFRPYCLSILIYKQFREIYSRVRYKITCSLIIQSSNRIKRYSMFFQSISQLFKFSILPYFITRCTYTLTCKLSRASVHKQLYTSVSRAALHTLQIR